ncbi:MAG: FixH family protein [Chitinophagaceae bacterium]
MNWGNKLLITFLVFGSLMGYLVYRSLNTHFELVENDYYKSELGYQQLIDGSKRLTDLKITVQLNQDRNSIVLELPRQLINNATKGELWFYCAYESGNDQRLPVKVDSSGTQFFPKDHFLPGNYSVKIKWVTGGIEYYTEKKLTIN